MRVWLLFILFTLPVFWSGCSGKKVDDSDPAALYQDAEDDIKNDQYLSAVDKLKTIRNKFPYSHFSADAQLRLGDVYFLQESFGESAAAYESFRDLHPKHDKVSYAMYRIGESYLSDAPENVARDLSSAKKAEDAFNDFLRRFPADPRVPDARTKLAQCRKLLAKKELYIGDFYNRDDQYESAKRRYEKLIENFPESEEAEAARKKLPAVEKALAKQQAEKLAEKKKE